MTFTPTFTPSDISSVSVDIVAGTGAALIPFTPLIGAAILIKKGKDSGMLSDFGLSPSKKTNVTGFLRTKQSGKTVRSKDFTIFD